MTIYLSSKAARLNVALTYPPAETRARFMAVLLPANGQLPAYDQLLAAQNSNDSLEFRKVPPGLYLLDASMFGMIYLPNLLLEKHSNEAPFITLSEGERKTISVPARGISDN